MTKISEGSCQLLFDLTAVKMAKESSVVNFVGELNESIVTSAASTDLSPSNMEGLGFIVVLYVHVDGEWLAHGMGFRDAGMLISACHVFCEENSSRLATSMGFALNGISRHMANLPPIPFGLEGSVFPNEKNRSLTGADLIGVPLSGGEFAAAGVKSYHGCYTSAAAG